jgi:hypothetical protein
MCDYGDNEEKNLRRWEIFAHVLSHSYQPRAAVQQF